MGTSVDGRAPDLSLEWEGPESVVPSPGLQSVVGLESRQWEVWLQRVHPDDASAARERLRPGAGGEALVLRLRTHDGGWKWFAVHAAPERLVLEDITRIKQLERALADSEARWEGLVSGAPVGISLISSKGTVLFSNGRCPPFLPPDSVGHHLGEFLGDAAEAFDTVSAECLSSGSAGTFTHGLLLSGGMRRLEHHVGPVRGRVGDPSVVVVSFDSTERHRVQQHMVRELQIQEFLLGLHHSVEDPAELFRQTLVAALAVFTSAVGFVAQKGTDGVFRVSSPHSSASELGEGPWRDAMIGTPVRMSESWEAPEGLGGGRVQGALVVPLRREQTVGFFVVGGREEPYTEQDLRDLQILAEGCWELVRRREVERANSLLLQTLESTPVSIVITDREGRMEYVNPRFSSVMGYSPKEAVGQAVSVLESEQNQPEILNGLGAAIRDGRAWAGEVLGRTKDGRTVWESVSVSPVFDPQGRMTHFVWAREDITQKKQTEEAIGQTRKMESVGQLAAGVAHDFNNLLGSLLAMNDMLLRKLEPGDPRRLYAEKIALAGGRASDLVSSLLAFGRRQRLKAEVLDLRAILKEESLLLESMLRGDVRFETDLDGDPLLTEMDGGQISQVVMNLVTNARDAAGPGGTVWLSAGRVAGSVFFSVRDNGPGIPSHLHEKIFEPFFTTKEIGQGTGLGLPVVSGIVAQHQGRISLENPPDGGALFTVYLPGVHPFKEHPA